MIKEAVLIMLTRTMLRTASLENVVSLFSQYSFIACTIAAYESRCFFIFSS